MRFVRDARISSGIFRSELENMAQVKESISSIRDERLSSAFNSLTCEARELYLPEKICEYRGTPTPLEFYRNWVCPNIPVIFKNSINHWPALQKWSPSYLREMLGAKEISVAVTPNGLADAVCENKFILAEDRKMLFSDFLDIMESPSLGEPGIFYVQEQNGNFTGEFPEIISDAETGIKWATEAFGKDPDAVNFWMGDCRAITSLHKDHYENLYCVISGQKTFTLYPPTDMPYIPHQEYMVARYHQNEYNKFEIINDPTATGHPSETIPWIPVDPLNPDYETYPEFAKVKSVSCTVKKGDVLYLPSLWFHHVQQTQATIAINFWYDMEYDIKYNYFKFLEKLCQ
jgi:hypothetical protein